MKYRYPDSRILVFAKAPVAGKVKTRLIPEVGARAAADLYDQLLCQTVDTAIGCNLAPLQLWCDPDRDHPRFQEFARQGVSLCCQDGPDLGLRMHNAFTQVLQSAHVAILIGADCPLMSCDYLHQAIEALSESDVVIGPAEDGGYVLIGMRTPNLSVFQGIEWGTDRVLSQTREALSGCKLSVQELPELWDVDRPTDLKRLMDQ